MITTTSSSTVTLYELEQQVKEVGGLIGKHLFEKNYITCYVFIPGYPDVFEVWVSGVGPLANVPLKPDYTIATLLKAISIKKEIIRLEQLLLRGYPLD
jgi:hypothetical protein